MAREPQPWQQRSGEVLAILVVVIVALILLRFAIWLISPLFG